MQYCPSCGRKNDDDADFCQFCGNPMELIQVPSQDRRWQQQQYPQKRFYVPPKNDDGAVTSLILGIASFLVCPIVLAVPAIIVGNTAKSRIAQSGGTLIGDGLATAGIVCGWINVVLSGVLLLIILMTVASSSTTIASAGALFSVLSVW